MLEQLEPQVVFKWFEAISQIPRGSKNEQAISDFLVKFAKDRNLEVYQDHELNVIIKKPASPGYEERKPIIVQGHMDMVPEKIKGSSHDFLKDPIELIIEDGWIRANGTTLGGDDGAAVAYALALLDGDYPHPPLEVLITTQEELGMEGALAVTDEHLTGAYLFNIDGEVEGELLVGCAGGVTITSKHQLNWTNTQLPDAFHISIEGLTGGHSGQEIEKSRANAIKLLARLVDQFPQPIELASMTGGSKHNAIPIVADMVCKTNLAGKLELETRAKALQEERQIADPDMQIQIEPCQVSLEEVWDLETQTQIINGLMAIPDGVIYMNPEFAGLVETSISNGVLEQSENELILTTLLRSATKSLETEVRRRFDLILTAFGFEVSDNGGYPGWEYDPHSNLRLAAIDVFKKQYGKEPVVKTIHCGLECGILKVPLPKTDMLTFGPDMLDIHTPKERLNIESVGRVWQFLLNLLISLD